MTWEPIETMPTDQYYLVKSLAANNENGPDGWTKEIAGTRMFLRSKILNDGTEGFVDKEGYIYPYKPTHWLKP